MKIIDPGHYYQLLVLDGDQNDYGQWLRFVKREGDKYPGNVGHYPGTNIQEVLRVCIDRLDYLNKQIPCSDNRIAQNSLIITVHALECRAADRHGRRIPSLEQAVHGDTCAKCGHVGCKGDCHA